MSRPAANKRTYTPNAPNASKVSTLADVKLSEKTFVEVVKGNYGIYARVKRMSPLKWINMSNSIMDTLDKKMTDIVAAVSQSEAKEWTLNKNLSLALTKFKGYWYLGFHQTDGDFQKNININMDEWKLLVEAWPRITSTMEGDETEKEEEEEAEQEPHQKKICKVEPKPVEVLPVYFWVTYTTQSVRRFYKIEDCQADASIQLQPNEPWTMKTEFTPVLAPKVWAKRIQAFLISRQIRDISTSSCPACSIDDPSQINHMDYCMDDWSNQVDQYFDKVDVTEAMVKDVYKKLMDHLGLKKSASYIHVKNMPTMEEFLKNSLDMDTIYLLDEVMHM